MKPAVGLIIVLAFSQMLASGQDAKGKRADWKYPPQMEGCRVETYKTVSDTKLNLYIFSPAAPKNSPAIVFFFGGGWNGGTPQQFETQCRALAKRGMVAITADYRVKSRHGVMPTQCVEDARSAIRWVRVHAEKLGVDPHRIAAGGGSAGGHLAACTAFIDRFDDPRDDRKVSAVPNALVLFNPALVLAPIEGFDAKRLNLRDLENRLGTKPEQISPAHQVSKDGPPTIIFHGREDRTVPFATAEVFTAKMKSLGNRCELIGYDGQNHGFFNSLPFRQETLDEADRFLVTLGWLKTR